MKILKSGTFSINCVFHAGAFDVNIEDIEPIPLTEDILVRHGFKHFGGGLYKMNDYNDFEIKKNNEGYMITSDGGNCYISEYFNYVHKLQNISFALTGKELEVKL